ncbi:hypothetical protein [Algisphaera agarilytica]|uniref:YbbR-like protein n=1 Tax=Algisphaera agarilytica TaxID=1385975 RepID=A0A7X0H3D9_9BACT|nr:hypothetical protein [Algisphaera agarilytica]MBB6428547.1 hypothetical protein [Algisphaera agarilytica]
MAQRKFHEKVETWIVVTIISVLVWLYAEATVLKQETGKTVQLLINEPTDRYAITPETEGLLVNYRASSGQIQRFNAITGVPLIHEIDPTGITEPTDRTIILDEALIRAGLGEIGITELDVEPATLTVTIEPLETIELPIEVQASNLKLSGNPVAEPASVSITGPMSMVSQLEGLYIIANLANANTVEGTGLERVATNVPLTFPSQYDPSKPGAKDDAPKNGIRVNYTLENDTVTTTLDRVPLHINLPVELQLRYTVRPEDRSNFLRDVELQGPADVIARIAARDPDLPVIRAELTITEPEKLDVTQAQQVINERPKIIAPAGVTPVQVPEVMPVTVRRRDNAPGN